MRWMNFIFLACLLAFPACSMHHETKETGSVTNEQTQSVDAIRDIGTAIEAYKLAYGNYPILKSGHLEEIRDKLVPKFLTKLKDKDGWGNKIEYYCLKAEGPYYIVSLGSDKTRDVGLYKTDNSPSGLGFNVISDFKEDIIFSNGAFVRYPKA